MDVDQDVSGLPARRAALRLIDAVLRRGETLDQAGHNAVQGLRSDADRALARALAAEALRWLTDLDALIDSATKQVLPGDAKPRMVLRLMLAGWLRLDTPPHAVIATALPLLTGGPRRLAHGVFSTLTKRLGSPSPSGEGLGWGPPIDGMHVGQAPPPAPLLKGRGGLPPVPTLPDTVRARWGERAVAVAAALAEPPPLDLTLREPADTARWAEALGGVSLMPGHVRLPRGQAIERLAGFDEGAWWVQDLAAGLPARLLGAGGGKRVLDLCSAPGGKTLQLAAAGWQVTSLDASAKRLERVSQNLARTGLSAQIVQADALQWQPEQPFDAVLLDAPCTATGTARRHPDVLHRIGRAQIGEMADLQRALLARAAGWVQPAGALIYAVCSLEREEGEAQAEGVTLTPDPIGADGLPAGLAATPEGWLRTDPGMLAEAGGLDGFFIARWRG